MKTDKAKYCLMQTKITVEEEVCISYGISCRKNNETIKEIADISTDRKFVEKLADTCNKYALDPLQLEDVVEDALCE